MSSGFTSPSYVTLAVSIPLCKFRGEPGQAAGVGAVSGPMWEGRRPPGRALQPQC